MARRRQKAGLADELVMLPWWVSFALGCLAFVTLRWIVPSIFAGNPFLTGLSAVSRFVSWLSLLFFGFIAVIAYARLKVTQPKEGGSAGRRSESWIPPHVPTKQSMKDLAHAWPASIRNSTDAAKPRSVFDSWTIEALRVLEWKRFELLCAKYYEAVGFKSETIRCGADGGIDVKLFKVDPSKPLAVVQCKAWNASPVGVKEVRELLGVMAHEKVGRGIFMTTNTFTRDALAFGAKNPLQLLDGDTFLRKIQALSKEQQDTLLKYAFEGDYRTPTCPSCGIKLTKRDSKRGPFWGCLNYPRCRTTFAMKS